ncbi:MAG: HD domain-containing phosphohydrolase, partial [Syntrophomonas sp.]
GNYEYSLPLYGVRGPLIIDLVLDPSKAPNFEYAAFKREGNILVVEGFCPAIGKSGIYMSATAAPLFNTSGQITGAIESLKNISERKLAEERLRHLSLYDSLTGLFNRTYFEEYMNSLETREIESLGIIVCDIDGLKLVNDTMGHRAGDKMLMDASRIINECIPDKATAARIGGDEFAIIVANTSSRTLQQTTVDIKAKLEDYNASNPDLPLSISIGYALTYDKDVNINTLFKKADDYMYREKLRCKRSVRSTIAQTLSKTLEARDLITKEHAQRLQELILSLTRGSTLSEHYINDLLILAEFHDIGKVGIPDKILFKAGPLTRPEKKEMQRHCEVGYNIALSVPELVPIADLILKHHEWWNGQGYPLGIRETDIPLACRILAVVDAYDAMTNDRPYRKAMNHESAIGELRRCAGTQFDPEIVDMFLNIS